jgi:preprotein translocase subunit SecA
MARHKDDLVQNTLNFAIVDEVDSILIDEARTPLIISAPDSESTSKYQTYAQLIPQLIENVDYNIDIKQKQASLSEAGIKKMENLLGIGNLFTEAGFQEVHHIEQSLKAQAIMIKDQDYIVKDDQVIIIDEFTGRLMDGRRYSDGLHQSLEAKENVVIQRESKTLATITFQNYFRLYDKLSGMTGTAETEAEEFAKIYGLDTIVIPTNKVMSRQDLTDKIFQNEVGKYKNLIQTVQELSSKGQPILIGTVHIEKSELLSELLTQHKISHEVLNAKNHAREAEIIAKAGQKGAITIATNMAGRGTDIKLGEGVNELGGLAILGTERHESRRIDNQLRGRAGRQGDNGLSQFYVAMNDDLMRRFGGEKLGKMMNNLGISNDEAIENRMISNSVENAQKRIEGFHFDARKHVVQYDDVVNIHREKIYAKRRIFLLSQKVDDEILKIIKSYATKLVQQNLPTEDANYSWNIQELIESLSTLHPLPAEEFSQENLSEERERGVIEKKVINLLLKIWQDKIQQNPTAIQEFAQQIVLQSIDELWLEHLNEMTNLRDRVALSGYAQKDPLMEYKAQAFEMFSNLLENINKIVVENLFRINFQAITSKELDSNVPINVQTNAEEINNQLVNNDLSTKNPEELTRSERRRLERKNKNNQ